MEVITQRLSIDKVSLPEWARDIANERGANNLVRKGFSFDDIKFVEGERASIHSITSTEMDRDQEIVIPKGLKLGNYDKNGKPVLWCHQYSTLPIGSCQWIKFDPATNTVLAKTRFSKHQLANDIYEHIKEHPLSASIGFIPIKWVGKDEYEDFDFKSYGLDPKIAGKASRIYTEAELLEYSLVPVPSNPSACQIAVSKGLISLDEIKNIGYVYEIIDPFKEGEKDGNEEQAKGEEQAEETKVEGSTSGDGEKGKVEFDLDLITKPDTANYVHIPAKGQEGKHQGHKIRTITISSSRGIKAHYCIPDKTITGYLFDSSKWSHDEAAQWVRDHSKIFDYDIQRLTEILSDAELDSYEYTEETYVALTSEKIEEDEKFCECEEPDFEDDECRGCGGRRKPRKPKKEFIEEIEDIGFGEVMHDEPNPLEIRMSDESEFVNDLFGVIELLSSRVQGLEIRLREVSEKAETKEFEVEEKAGRILSKKTRETIQRAIDALNELITLADKPKDDDEEDDDEDEKKDLILEDIELAEGDKIDSVVKEVLSDIFTTYDIDVKDFVDEAMKKMKGKMF